MAISVTVKRRPRIVPETIVSSLDGVIHRHAGIAEELYGQSVETWKQKPGFQPKTFSEQDDYFVNIYARGEMRSIYHQIDAGFNRQVAVTEDWISKTWPGILRARAGRGHLLKHNGKPVLLQSPEPVVARQFTKMVADLIRANFLSEMKSTFKKHFEVNNG